MNMISPEAMAVARRSTIRENLLSLLCNEKKDEITVKCGLRALDQIVRMPEYQVTFEHKSLYIADCWVNVEKDFDLDPWEIWYNDILIFE